VRDRNTERFDPGLNTPRSASASATVVNDAVELVASRLDVGRETLRASAALLCRAERQRATRFFFDRDRRRFIVARARLRQLLSARLGMPPEAVELVYATRGKPALAPSCAASDLRFSVSHSNDLAVYAFSSGREIGIDIETIRVIRDADDIAARFFSRSENEAYLALDPRDRPLGFFNCWTRKEAFVKALGTGLGYPLDRFDVSLSPGEPAKILRVDSTPGDSCGWTLHSFVLGPALVGAVVVRTFAYETASMVRPPRIEVRSLPGRYARAATDRAQRSIDRCPS
jgi:4'-phosphopantetheinyl transferase